MGKPDYSGPKAHRPIALLNYLGKTPEKLMATRLGSPQPTPSGPNRRPSATLHNRRGNCPHPHHRSRQKGQEDYLSPLPFRQRLQDAATHHYAVFQYRLGTGPATSSLTDRQPSMASKNRSNRSRQGSHTAPTGLTGIARPLPTLPLATIRRTEHPTTRLLDTKLHRWCCTRRHRKL